MEEQLRFVPKLSLEEMTLRRIVINLWTEADSLEAIGKLFKLLSRDEDKSRWDVIDERKDYDWKSSHWLETIETVKPKVLELVLPLPLKKRMLDIYRPIFLELLRWVFVFHSEVNLSNLQENWAAHIMHLSWTSAGAVDYRKTAENLVRLETLDVTKRFELACLYCLEDYIPILWEELTDQYKWDHLNHLDNYNIVEAYLVYYWASLLTSEELRSPYLDLTETDALSVHKRGFQISACEGQKAATEFFFQKLNKDERDSVLLETTRLVINGRPVLRSPHQISKQRYSDVLCYLLSVMTPAERLQIFNSHPGQVLKYFLEWPWQELFLDIADLIWIFLPKSNYLDVLHNVNMRIASTGFYCPRLLQEFYTRSPRDFRKLFALNLEMLFDKFSCVPDTETFKVVFRNLDPEDRSALVSSLGFSELLKCFIWREDWRFVAMCIRETLHSREDIQILKNANSGNLCSFLAFLDIINGTKRLQRFNELLNKTKVSSCVRKSS